MGARWPKPPSWTEEIVHLILSARAVTQSDDMLVTRCPGVRHGGRERSLLRSKSKSATDDARPSGLTCDGKAAVIHRPLCQLDRHARNFFFLSLAILAILHMTGYPDP